MKQLSSVRDKDDDEPSKREKEDSFLSDRQIWEHGVEKERKTDQSHNTPTSLLLVGNIVRMVEYDRNLYLCSSSIAQ